MEKNCILKLNKDSKSANERHILDLDVPQIKSTHAMKMKNKVAKVS